MSRSFKTTPISKDHRSGVVGKTLANRRVRRVCTCIPNGKAYKKCFNTYDVHDYISRWPWVVCRSRAEAKDKAYANGGLWYEPNMHSDVEARYNEWAREYYRK